ncbi:MAG: pyridoxal phosphate-dependent aminotransferase family protein [Minisyncoccia bacterium]|jgi:8-amino-7-oxononanoate synthase
MKSLSQAVNFIKKHGFYPYPPVVSSPHAPEVVVNGKKVLMFATNNYLDLMTDPRVIEAAVQGARKWGIGNGSARLLTGNLEIHNQLEEKIAAFKHREAAVSFVSGYMANSGTIPALVNVPKFSLASLFSEKIAKDKDTIIFSDEYNHASAIAGIRLSGAKKEIYKHLDINDLLEKLKNYPVSQRKMIVTDGVFSMDGDIAPLPQILEQARQYKAIVYLDDAHGTGILGPHGRGVEDYYNVEGQVDVIMGTFTKCFGGVGGFVVGSKDLVDYLKITSDSFIFTAPIAPPVVCGLIKSIEIATEETWRREKVLANALYMKDQLANIGINFLNSRTQIIPIFIGNEKKAMDASVKLLERGIFIPAARWPAVPKGKARLRTTVSTAHTKEQINVLIENLKEIKSEIGF